MGKVHVSQHRAGYEERQTNDPRFETTRDSIREKRADLRPENGYVRNILQETGFEKGAWNVHSQQAPGVFMNSALKSEPLKSDLSQPSRRGVATLDYVLILGAALPMAGASIYLGSKIVRLAYQMICVLVGWPLM